MVDSIRHHYTKESGKADGESHNESPPGATGWSARNVGRAWQLGFFHKLIALTGQRGAYHMMYLVVLWYVIFSPEIRRRTRHYLDRRFPERRGCLRSIWDSYRLVCSFGQVLIDQAALAVKGTDIIDADCINEREMKEAASACGGAILLVSHFGCWQIAMTSLGFLNRSISAVMMPQGEDSPVARIMGERLPFTVIDPRNGMESVLEMIRSLKRAEILAIMGDRVFGGKQNRIRTAFLGDRASLPALPYVLAAATGAPVLVMQAVRMDYRSYKVALAGTIRVEKVRGGGMEKYSEAAASRFAAMLEAMVREHPWQFFNFFDLWDDIQSLEAHPG